MCSIIGSLCDKICGVKSCYASCCNTTTIVIGQLNGDQNPLHVHAPSRDNLFAAFEHVSAIEGADQVINHHTVTVLNVEELELEISLGILEFTRYQASQLAAPAPKNRRKEGFARFQTAAHLCGIDMAAKYALNDPLSKSEKSKIKKMAKQIQNYGSSAAYLWHAVKRDDLVGSTCKKVCQSMRKKHADFYVRSRACASFSDLGTRDKKVYLEASKLMKKGVGFTPWTVERNLERDFMETAISRSDFDIKTN